MKRIFIAINLPEDIKSVLADFQDNLRSEFGSRAVKWVDSENLHITLAFLGSMRPEKADEMIEKFSNFQFSSFSIKLSKVEYFPSRRKAKLIWVRGSSDKLLELKDDLDLFLEKSKIINYEKDSDFITHVTLGRTRSFDYNKIPLEEIPLLEDSFDLEFEVESLEIMESKLKKAGPEYITLKSYKNKK